MNNLWSQKYSQLPGHSQHKFKLSIITSHEKARYDVKSVQLTELSPT